VTHESSLPLLLDIVQAATEPIITIDAARRIVMFNPAAERVFLHEAEQVIGESVDILIPARFRRAHAEQIARFKETGVSRRRMGAGVPLWGLKANGEEFPMEASICHVASSSGTFFSVFLRDISERQQTEQALRASRDELTRLSNALLHEREQERKHIARELHDDLGQSLTALAMELTQLELELSTPCENASRHIAIMRNLIRGSFISLRRIASDLRPIMLDDLGLEAALEWLASDFTSRYGVKVAIHVDTGQRPLPTLISTALFRVVQEALTNIAKHARATRADLCLCCTDVRCTLLVQDNGIGTTPEHLASALPNCLGLLGIRERVRLLNGAVNIHTSPGNGLTMEVMVPLEQSGSC